MEVLKVMLETLVFISDLHFCNTCMFRLFSNELLSLITVYPT